MKSPGKFRHLFGTTGTAGRRHPRTCSAARPEAWPGWVNRVVGFYTWYRWSGCWFHVRLMMSKPRNGMTIPIDMKISGWWFGTWLDYEFPYIGNVIIPTDELIFFQRGRYTTNQLTTWFGLNRLGTPRVVYHEMFPVIVLTYSLLVSSIYLGKL